MDLKLISTVSRRFLLALVVAASPFAFGQSPVEAAPMTVTVTLYSTISGPGNYGYCRQGTEDMGDPYGNVDFGNAGVELGELQGRPVATWGQVNYGETRFVEWNHRPCGGRGDSAAISLASIPVNAIVQSATLSYHMLGASSNNPGTAYGVIIAPFGSLSSVTTGSLDCNCWWSKELPLSTAQTWVSNRTSGGLSITYGDYWNGWWYTSDQQTLTITYTTDTTPPTTTHALSGTVGNNGWYTTDVIVTLTATDNAGGTGVASTTLDGSAYTTARTISTEGTTSHTYFSVDNSSNIETTNNLTLKIDKTAPSAAITSHTSNQAVRGTISFGGTASDATSGLASVETSSNGDLWNSATVTSGSWTYSLNTTALTDGTRTIQVRVTDNAGNQTTTSLALLVDNTKPASSFASTPTDNSWYAGSVTFSGTSSDATSGVSSLQRRTDSGGWSTLSGTTTWSFTVDTTTLSDGTHTFYVAAKDVAGNLESTAVKTINVGNNPPVSSLEATCPAPGSNGWCKAPINVVVSAGSTAPLQSVSYWIDGNSDTTVNQGSTSFGITGGVHSASTYATSILGKKSNTVTKADLKVDGSPPTIEFRGATQTALIFRVSDGDSGVQSWTLQVFNAQGQTVFYKDGAGEFNGDLAWSQSRGGSSGIGKLYSLLPQSNQFKINIFAKDNAGHQNGVQQAQFTLNVIATPLPTFTPTSTPHKVAVLPAVINTATARPSATPMPTTTQPTNPTATGIRVAALPPAPLPIAPLRLRTVSGYVFWDRNGNGVRDLDEPGLGNIPLNVRVSVIGGGMTTYSGDDGAFVVTVSQGPAYVIQPLPSAGWFGDEQKVLPDIGADMQIDFALTRASLVWLVSLFVLGGVLFWMLVVSVTQDRRAHALWKLAGVVSSLTQRRLEIQKRG